MDDELDIAIKELLSREPQLGYKAIFAALQSSGAPATSLGAVTRRVRKLRSEVVSDGLQVPNDAVSRVAHGDCCAAGAGAGEEPPQALVSAMELLEKASPGECPWEAKKCHVHELQRYIATHPNSSTARRLLASLALHAQCLVKLEACDVGGALESAGWAVLYDEKGLEWRGLEDINLNSLLTFARTREANPVLASVFIASAPNLDFAVRMAAAEKAVSDGEAHPDMMPRILQLRGSTHSYRANFDSAIADLEHAMACVQNGVHLYPPLADGKPPIPLETDLAHLMQELGSTLQCSGRIDEGAQYLERFVRAVGDREPDSYTLPKACYELAIGDPRSGSIASPQALHWVQQAQRFDKTRLFVFPPYESQKKMVALMAAEMTMRQKGSKGKGKGR